MVFLDLNCAGDLVDHLFRPPQNFSGNGQAIALLPSPFQREVKG
jgi:hypothetical protein